MPDRLSDDTQPIADRAGRLPASGHSDRIFYAILGVGMLMGVVLSITIGLGLYTLGYVDVGGAAGEGLAACPATPDMIQACGTVDAMLKALHTATATATHTATPEPTATATATPDLQATATAACATFQLQFPGTPCP
jgi:hypothetical protein